MRRRLTIIVLVILTLAGLAGLGLPALMRWNWGGPALLASFQDHINGKITAGAISGNPCTGITYKDLLIQGPDGKTLLRTARLNLRLSLRSLPAGHLILDKVAFSSPLLQAVQVSGHWNLETFLKSEAPPHEAHGLIAGVTAFFLRRLEHNGSRGPAR